MDIRTTIRFCALALVVVLAALVGQSSQSSMSDEEVQTCVLKFSQDLSTEMPEVAKKIEAALRAEDPALKDLTIAQLIESKRPVRICGGLDQAEDLVA